MPFLRVSRESYSAWLSYSFMEALSAWLEGLLKDIHNTHHQSGGHSFDCTEPNFPRFSGDDYRSVDSCLVFHSTASAHTVAGISCPYRYAFGLVAIAALSSCGLNDDIDKLNISWGPCSHPTRLLVQ